MNHTIKVNIAGIWNNYNFEEQDDATTFLSHVRNAIQKSATDPNASFTAGDDDEMSVILGKHIVGYTIVRSKG